MSTTVEPAPPAGHSPALQQTIEAAYERRQSLSSDSVDTATRAAIVRAVAALDSGASRVAEKIDGRWQVHTWLKKAVLLYFRITDNHLIDAGYTHFYDKVPLKYAAADAAQFAAGGVRVVPHALVRHGAYVAPGAVLMPSYVNIGAYVDAGTMVDTWATVGSCAQIGRNVHLSGGVGIGGVLEPLQAAPTIIEDDCFIGARSEIVEGVVVGAGSVISMGVFHRRQHPHLRPHQRQDTAGRGAARARSWCPARCRPRTAATASTAP